MNKLVLVICLLTLVNLKTNCQTNLYFQLGYGYLEHLSTGLGVKIKDNHRLSLQYGSNFFMNTHDFSVIQLQYEYPCQITHKYKINAGIKSGYSIYANTYYRWKLVSITPMVNFNLSLKNKLLLVSTLGLNYSRVIEAKRIAKGEIGWYNEFLPEFKISLLYDL